MKKTSITSPKLNNQIRFSILQFAASVRTIKIDRQAVQIFLN